MMTFTTQTQPTVPERDHSACGVGMIVNVPRNGSAKATRQIVEDSLKTLASFDYRAGCNLVTGESDGAGIKFYGLSVSFFEQLIRQGKFSGTTLNDCALIPGQFGVGQFFLSLEPEACSAAKAFIENQALVHQLQVIAWRNLEEDLSSHFLTKTVQSKKPAIWQALIIPDQSLNLEHIEMQFIRMAQQVVQQGRETSLKMDLCSLSSEFITYKGMLHPTKLAAFYQDLNHQEFTARAAILHSRFATNTNPQWANAQPCVFYWAHNGELNSAQTNAAEMFSELKAMNFSGVYPNNALSDSMQFDADLANQTMMHGYKLDEAMMRLMSPQASFSDEVNAMLTYWRLQRTPYNGPAFAVAASRGQYITALDGMGLRPSHLGLTQDAEGNQTFYATSDDLLDHTTCPNRILWKRCLEPGGMVMINAEGVFLDSSAILESIATRYNHRDPQYFQKKLAQTLIPETAKMDQDIVSDDKIPVTDIFQRILYSVGWDLEAVEGLKYMAEYGSERTGAMGDDTNNLHSEYMPPYLAYFFHQLFAQVSAPSLDSIKERDRFSLKVFLGAFFSPDRGHFIELSTPFLSPQQFLYLQNNSTLNVGVVDCSFPRLLLGVEDSITEHKQQLEQQIKLLLERVQHTIDGKDHGVIILSDRHAEADRMLIPDLIAVSALKRYLEYRQLDTRFSIVVDSYQMNSPHHASVLLAMGAKALYPRGAYAKINLLFPDNTAQYLDQYANALQKCLLKTMGKMGITDVNNYINGSLIATMGLDLSTDGRSIVECTSLGTIFPKLYAPFKGIHLGHIAKHIINRHSQAFDPNANFLILPAFGHFMPVKEGLNHGFGPSVVVAFSQWMHEEDLTAIRVQMHRILVKKGYPNYFKERDSKDGYLDSSLKNKDGFYIAQDLEAFQPSVSYRTLETTLTNYRYKYPTAIRDHFTIVSDRSDPPSWVQSQAEIRSLLFAGSMSQGALTVSNPGSSSELGAHETLTRAMNAVGAHSASGEGGEAPQDLLIPLNSARSKQIASARFGISAAQLLAADEIEIKIAQGAKPGEGGELPGHKVSIRFASQRGGLPGVNFISPPPHHDIYSIEDLAVLISDVKALNPKIKVAVKLVASQGIGTIAVGVAKAGADVINIASNSGGTGAAQQSSIKHAGLPSELGLAEVDKALRKARLRDRIQLRVSGGFKTAEEVITAAILGADLFEFGTTAMLTLGCKMQRTCNQYCQPGVAANGDLYKGTQINVERYFVNLAAMIQTKLKELGYSSLRELRGRTDLLHLVNTPELASYDFESILDRSNLPPDLNEEELEQLHYQQKQLLAISSAEQHILDELRQHDESAFIETKEVELNTSARTFPARVINQYHGTLKNNPKHRIKIKTKGIAGQSFGFVNCSGIILEHTGSAQDGCGKSMTGGELIIRTPVVPEYIAHHNLLVGNAALYGASGGVVHINGEAGHRFGILIKGCQVTVEGVGEYAFEYMTSGTGLILGAVGKGLATGASGGIIICYDPTGRAACSQSVRRAELEETIHYESTIKSMLEQHLQKTNSILARQLIELFDVSHYQIFIPREMDKINSMQEIIDIVKTYQLRQAPLTEGMQVWFEQKMLQLIKATNYTEQFNELIQLLEQFETPLISKSVLDRFKKEADKQWQREQNRERVSKKPKISSESFDISDDKLTSLLDNVSINPKSLVPTEDRVKSISGSLDYQLLDALKYIQSFVGTLQLEASGCSGCRAQSCSGNDQVDTGCPGGKEINTINAFLKRIGQINNGILTYAQWDSLRKAFNTQIYETPFIAYTGAACPEPCASSCTESIPVLGAQNPTRGGKPVGEPVHIKSIEFYLFVIGRALGWFDGKKEWTPNEISAVFGTRKHFDDYTQLMNTFSIPFSIPRNAVKRSEELIIIGSGPAGMQLAYKGLREGLTVTMYEKSDKPGGLLADGIPAHKFDKEYLAEDFARLQAMGLTLHLNCPITFNEHTGNYFIDDATQKIIASQHRVSQLVALCTGTGAPRELPAHVTQSLPESAKNKVIQATNFLKAANKLASILKNESELHKTRQDDLIKTILGSMDPRGKKIVVVGGGDTAQDVCRWLARYLTQSDDKGQGKVSILNRGPESRPRGIKDSFPFASRAPTDENVLKAKEIAYIQAEESYFEEPQQLIMNAHGKMDMVIKKSRIQYAEVILNDAELKKFHSQLPREQIPLEVAEERVIKDVDLVICAMGFERGDQASLVRTARNYSKTNNFLAGDVAGTGIIIAAQNSANKTWKDIQKKLKIDCKSKLVSQHGIFAPTNSCGDVNANKSFANCRM